MNTFLPAKGSVLPSTFHTTTIYGNDPSYPSFDFFQYCFYWFGICFKSHILMDYLLYSQFFCLYI